MKGMREEVHSTHSYPVIIYPKAGGSPIETKARAFYKMGYLGDQLGTNLNYIQISDYAELEFVFWRELTPQINYGDIITTPWQKTYVLDAEEVQDKFTYKVLGAAVPPQKEGDYPYPNG
jgi:hypothetical protein